MISVIKEMLGEYNNRKIQPSSEGVWGGEREEFPDEMTFDLGLKFEEL